MAYILDAIILVIVLLSLWNGHRRGFVLSLSRLAAFVLAIVVAFCLSGAVAGFLYDHTLAPSIQKSLTDNMAAAGNTIESGLNQAVETLPAFIRNVLTNQGTSDGAGLLNLAGGSGDAATVAATLTTGAIRTAVMPLLRVLCFLVLFILAMIVARLLLRVLDGVVKLPLLKQMNKTLGLVAGAVSGLLGALIAVSLLQVVAAMSSPTALINQALLEQTYIVKFLIHINPLGGALREVMSAVQK